MIITGTGTNKGFEIEELSNPFKVAFDEYEAKHSFTEIKAGAKVTGVLSRISDKYAYVMFGGKNEIQVPLTVQEKITVDNLQINEEVSVIITSIVDDLNYDIYGSFHELKLAELADFLNDAVRNKVVITGIVKDMSFAGYTVNANVDDNEINLFMPHLLTDVNKLPNAESIIGTEIEFLLQEINKDGQKSYLASRKAHLLNKAFGEMKKLQLGQQYEGFVTGATDFAIFVQFNECLTGMIHKSNLTPLAIEYLEGGKITPGMTIGFYVKDIIKNKLFLTQINRDSLWDSIKTNDILTGTVSAIKDFGVMVDLDFETKGLLHKSVLSKPADSYTKGQEVVVVVTNVNKNNRQITLALK